ncbi:hypothetical protein [Flagellimonas myxillae]|uniref:hypothetical protein n=1 Tax=Flagellimonas myxillae TaxID=2942214 RepID=UPI00201F32CD|nr:hypothetical protein [Muricauda myxillae]MCL6265269.1 hypothetical protein [Muricauda myxillae]
MLDAGCLLDYWIVRLLEEVTVELVLKQLVSNTQNLRPIPLDFEFELELRL